MNPGRTALLGLAVIWGLASLSQPYIAARDLREHEIARLQAQLKARTHEHEQLSAEQRRLLTQKGMEEVMHGQGYINAKEGERRLVIQEPATSGQPPAAAPPGPSAELAAAPPDTGPVPPGRTPGAVRLKQETRAAIDRVKARIGRLFGR